ncbi:MAG: GIY-YIG nuclease family protein [Flavobacteriales bacterium]
MPIGYMYILECCGGSFYTGSTVDLARRVTQHQSGNGSNFTRDRLPIKLLYSEKYDRIDYAFTREKQVQKWSRAKKIALMNGDLNELHEKAKCLNKTHYSNKQQ